MEVDQLVEAGEVGAEAQQLGEAEDAGGQQGGVAAGVLGDVLAEPQGRGPRPPVPLLVRERDEAPAARRQLRRHRVQQLLVGTAVEWL